MTEFALIMWQVVLYGLLGIAFLVVSAVWLFIVYSVIRSVAEFYKAFKETKNLDESEFL